ncbi:hypothetical protein AVEN_259467-1 [Araneus ventricosus]|uniref:Uncharacterized protein n=1 Tax=Araneus ventricosus TaxID=182803 RepID=A0A4Y2I1F4_ARAVE|nr:hypothetical protein AVEN_259467-1 [Araneus ventricosus]
MPPRVMPGENLLVLRKFDESRRLCFPTMPNVPGDKEVVIFARFAVREHSPKPPRNCRSQKATHDKCLTMSAKFIDVIIPSTGKLYYHCVDYSAERRCLPALRECGPGLRLENLFTTTQSYSSSLKGFCSNYRN